MYRAILVPIVVVALASCPAIAPAEVIWSYYPIGFQTERHEIITWCEMSLCFYNLSTGVSSPAILNETVDSSSQGMTFTATAQTDPNFNDFVSRIRETDNENDAVYINLTTNSGTDLSTGEYKSVVFNGCPDLTHETIGSVSLTLNEFVLDTPGNDIWHDGIDTYFSEAITFSISTPEPTSLVLAAGALIGMGALAMRHRKRR
jgi:hypothetical protein